MLCYLVFDIADVCQFIGLHLKEHGIYDPVKTKDLAKIVVNSVVQFKDWELKKVEKLLYDICDNYMVPNKVNPDILISAERGTGTLWVTSKNDMQLNNKFKETDS